MSDQLCIQHSLIHNLRNHLIWAAVAWDSSLIVRIECRNAQTHIFYTVDFNIIKFERPTKRRPLFLYLKPVLSNAYRQIVRNVASMCFLSKRVTYENNVINQIKKSKSKKTQTAQHYRYRNMSSYIYKISMARAMLYMQEQNPLYSRAMCNVQPQPPPTVPTKYRRL